MKKRFILWAIVVALVLTYATNSIKRNDVSYNIPTGCNDCFTGYTTFGFPFESLKLEHGGFTGEGIGIPLVGLPINFGIYLILSGAVIYLVLRRKSVNIAKTS
jgi:hypothetical protein